ncbi:fused DSP-PTPase phosphatase/NAD kinase-like protein [Tropicibacter naphthalenivorans]|uniref:Protein tyrosine/serine phosphatase n=1 Tax=Tropicibacter naphthalenivorans TaxID=441103 RepID=A0A0P1GHN1_9RHOB|nr:dual specificity protein phosphatase family protein [Tropicibacter naphthalenivorans]CUH81480.1 Protein tyrosine/serine phosphatase [Tropicibacter naphthalenivorans]SMD00202.1 Dual specificity phosphatase, catalytic domain [Tropicibacter naphthalenivorans]
MLKDLWTKIDNAERRLRHSFGRDISTPEGRRWSRFHYHVFDHAFLRVLWTNFYQIAPGVWRSNQPTHARFEKYAAMGIKTVVNLRGEDGHAHYLFEKESCDALGLKLINAKIHARNAASLDRVIGVIDALRAAEKPMLFHCKSGADRAGFTAAMYLMIFEGASVDEAMKQLSLKYIHLDFTATGIQDYILRVYKARLALGEIGFEDWIRTEYNNGILQNGWDTRRPEAEVAAELIESARP